MAELPESLNDAIAQAREATQAALADGYTRLQVELVFPELKVMPVVEQFLPTFDALGLQLKVLFPDTGAAALARRDWGPDFPFPIDDIGTSRSPVDRKIRPEDEIFLVVEPGAVEVAQVERLCQLVEPRPVVLLNPRLEDAATIGIGYAGRQLRERFLNTLESCYYICPLEQGVLFRCYPSSWQVWQETEDEYELLAEVPKKPVGDVLDRIFTQTTATPGEAGKQSAQARSRGGFLASLDRFLRALTQ